MECRFNPQAIVRVKPLPPWKEFGFFQTKRRGFRWMNASRKIGATVSIDILKIVAQNCGVTRILGCRYITIKLAIDGKPSAGVSATAEIAETGWFEQHAQTAVCSKSLGA